MIKELRYQPYAPKGSKMKCDTETLSEYLERDITSEKLADIKRKVQDKYCHV
jgi:hypothetical protein